MGVQPVDLHPDCFRRPSSCPYGWEVSGPKWPVVGASPHIYGIDAVSFTPTYVLLRKNHNITQRPRVGCVALFSPIDTFGMGYPSRGCPPLPHRAHSANAALLFLLVIGILRCSSSALPVWSALGTSPSGNSNVIRFPPCGGYSIRELGVWGGGVNLYWVRLPPRIQKPHTCFLVFLPVVTALPAILSQIFTISSPCWYLRALLFLSPSFLFSGLSVHSSPPPPGEKSQHRRNHNVPRITPTYSPS